MEGTQCSSVETLTSGGWGEESRLFMLRVFAFLRYLLVMILQDCILCFAGIKAGFALTTKGGGYFFSPIVVNYNHPYGRALLLGAGVPFSG